MLNFEYERTVREHFKIFNLVPYDASFKFSFDLNEKWEFTEMFEGYVDVMNFGPRAIGLDFTFVNEHLVGLPEHAADFRL